MSASRAIDSVYEFIGYQTASSLRGALWSLGLFALVTVAGTLWIFHQAAQKNDGKLAWNYLLQMVFAVVCFIPISIPVGARELPNARTGVARQEAVQGPLILALTHRLVDSVARVVTDDSSSVFAGSAFEWERIVAATESARIHDATLSTRFHAYLKNCYWRAIANLRGADRHPVQEASDLAGAEPLREHDFFVAMMKRDGWTSFIDLGGDSYVANCADERVSLLRDLRAHLTADPVHGAIIADIVARQAAQNKMLGAPLTAAQFEGLYLYRLIDNEAKGLSRDAEAELVARAIPGFSLADQRFDVAPLTAGEQASAAEAILAKGATTLAIADEWLGKYSKAPVLYYRFSLWAPAIYGFVVCFLIALFPLVMLWSLWPGKWLALVNFFKVFVAVKFVPVLWSWLSALNAARAGGDLDPAHQWFPGIVALYLAAPMISYFMIAGVTKAAMNVGGQLLGHPLGGAGGGGGMMGGAARHGAQKGLAAGGEKLAA